MDLSVVIVNYNVRYFLEQCLHSVFSSGKGLNMEVFVVDNNSVDGSMEMVREKFPSVHRISNDHNAGFSRGNNQALKLARGRYLLLLNPDTVLEKETLPLVLQFMESHPDAGGLGVKMVDGQGRFLPESKRGLPTPLVAFCKIFGLSRLFPRSPLFGRYHLGFLDHDKTHTVDVLSGAFMLLRKETLEATGLLDEAFFMYGEDIDLSYRITLAGYKNYYYPGTRIIHYKGESTKKSSINYVFVFYNAMIIFAQKHFSRGNIRVFTTLINMAIYFRAMVAIGWRFLKRIAWPLADATLIFIGMGVITDFWELQEFAHKTNYYPPLFMTTIVPSYIIFWLTAVYFSGGYDPPLKLSRITKGIVAGTIAILVAYALIPASLRFSRALILLGSAWAAISMVATRVGFHSLKNKRLSWGEPVAKRALVVGSGNEATRIAELLDKSENVSFSGIATPGPTDEQQPGYLGTMDQINEIIQIYRINEVIFCAGEIPSEAIIDQMSALRRHDINFKIAPPESLFIIGSNSIESFGDLFTVSINAINRPFNRRNKRAFDLITALFIFITLPLHLVFVRHKAGLIKNLFSVIVGYKSWVGYHPDNASAKLPFVRPGVLYPDDAFMGKRLQERTIRNLNKMYAKDYRIENDLGILLRGYRQLGRQ